MRLDDSRFWFGALSEDLAYAIRLRTSAWLGTVLRASALVLAATGIAAVATRSTPVWWIYGSFASVLAAALALDLAKRVYAAGIVLSLGFWLVATSTVFVLGGVRSPGSFVYLPIVVTAGLFWSWRAAATLTAASLGVEILAAWLDAVHRLPEPIQAPTAGPLLRIFAGSLTMTAVLVGVALHSMRGALQDVRRHALRTEELLLHVPDVLAIVDRLGIVLAVGPSMQKRLGYEPAELVGKHVSRVELFAGNGRSVGDEFRQLGVRVAEGAREFELRSKGGAVAWGEARMHALPIGKGDSLRRIVLYDVTRRHVAEEGKSELEKRVEQGKRFETMGLMVGGLTHDLNNLLTVILSVGSVLDAQLAPDSQARDMLRDMNQSAMRAAELARRLLAAKPAKPAHAIDVSREMLALEPILSRMAGDGIKLTLRSHAAPCFSRIEKGDLERIATNLLVNARDAMPGGGEVTIEIARAREDGDGKSAHMIELSVTDSGTGLDATTQRRMFEPFYTTKGEDGTGLGLATVDAIVSRLGGYIRVDSKPGLGTTLRVFFPECRAADSGVSSSPSTAYGTRPE